MAINDDKWKILFERHNIVTIVAKKGHFDITAEQIKTVREPRLMCKMDFKQSVAKPFKDNDLSILAIKNGLYRIAKTSPFFEIDVGHIGNIPITDFQLPTFIETLHFENITSESQALDAAVASGMLNTLLEEDSFLTVRGRRYTSAMEINIKRNDSDGLQPYPISSVQIEVDGGYEGKSVLALIEAKMGTADNMNMRQLVYPHIHFSKQTKKTVKTYVMFYETGSLFTFIPMLIENDIPSLEYTNAVRYRLIESEASDEPIVPTPVAKFQLPKTGNGAPFPQADDFSKVIYGLLKLGESQPISKQELFGNFDLDPRQFDYYFNALRWLGLAEQEGRGGDCILTDEGEYLFSVSEKNRISLLYDILRSDPLELEMLTISPSEYTPRLLTKNNMSGSTPARRKSTIVQWDNYLRSFSRLT